MFEQSARLEELLPLMQEQLAAGKYVRFFPRGTSMLPMLRQGIDSVTLAPLPKKLKKFDLPLYRRENGQFVLHRIVRTGETYTCIGDNQFQLEPGVKPEQMIALVVRFSRGEREWSVDAPAYRLYCRVWNLTRPVRHIYRWGRQCAAAAWRRVWK